MTQGATRVRRLAFWTIPLAFIVFGLKLGAWYITGSVALLSDALESIVNVIAALVAFFVIGYAHKPADEGHPYGHSKAEYFSAVIEGVLIVLAALMIVNAALPAILEPERIDAPFKGLAVNAVAAVINGVWAWILIREGRSHRSPALEADGHHIMSDVVTSSGVIIGLVLALALDMPILDPQLSPDGECIGYVHDAELYVADVQGGGGPRQLTTGARGTGKTHGLAEFIAQEEMGRSSGFWWSHDGSRIAFAEVDDTHIPVYRIVHQSSEGTGADAVLRAGRQPVLPTCRSALRRFRQASLVASPALAAGARVGLGRCGRRWR